MAKGHDRAIRGWRLRRVSRTARLCFCANDIAEAPSSASAAEKARTAKRMTSYLTSLLAKTVSSTLKTHLSSESTR